MTTIKRYRNRKLYNTETKTYITLGGVVELIRSGKDVEVIDATDGTDMTNTILNTCITKLQIPTSDCVTLIKEMDLVPVKVKKTGEKQELVIPTDFVAEDISF